MRECERQWLTKRLLLFDGLFVESGGIEIVLFSGVGGWFVTILVTI